MVQELTTMPLDEGAVVLDEVGATADAQDSLPRQPANVFARLPTLRIDEGTGRLDDRA